MNKLNEVYRKQLIGACCRDHRKNVLHLTLEQFQAKTGVNFKTVSSFENGRNGNIYYMFDYINLTNNTDDRLKLMLKLLKVSKEVLK